MLLLCACKTQQPSLHFWGGGGGSEKWSDVMCCFLYWHANMFSVWSHSNVWKLKNVFCTEVTFTQHCMSVKSQIPYHTPLKNYSCYKLKHWYEINFAITTWPRTHHWKPGQERENVLLVKIKISQDLCGFWHSFCLMTLLSVLCQEKKLWAGFNSAICTLLWRTPVWKEVYLNMSL